MMGLLDYSMSVKALIWSSELLRLLFVTNYRLIPFIQAEGPEGGERSLELITSSSENGNTTRTSESIHAV